jgi:hypothetical protein
MRLDDDFEADRFGQPQEQFRPWGCCISRTSSLRRERNTLSHQLLSPKGLYGASLISQLGSCRSILLTSGSYFDVAQSGISCANCCLRRKGPHFVDNQRFISAAMRNCPASPSASLRRCPNGILRASAITSVARASQSWLWADCANIRLRGELIMMLPE